MARDVLTDGAPAPPLTRADGHVGRVQVLRRLLGDAGCRQLGIYAIPSGLRLSVVIPVYNERRWLHEVVRRAEAVPIPKEIILVDDGSTDGSRDILRELEGRAGVRVFYQPANRDKGAALRAGFRHAAGDVVLMQDADLEYDPAEYPRLIQPILDGRADVVYGSRFIGDQHHVLYF
jgi:glycosyltransferase involved in cell wall biosynthesis